MLFDGLRRDYTRFDERQDVDLDNPWLGWVQHLSYRLGEARGWSGGVRAGVTRALIIVLSGHVEGDVVFYSAMFCALRALELSCERTAEVLDQMGILLDDRRPAFEDWLEGKLDGIAPGIAGEVETWLRRLRDGGPRARPRNIATVWHYANAVRPILLQWSTIYDHRQVLLGWLDYRRTHWPHTANPHLLLNQTSAMGTAPVSQHWLDAGFRGQDATLERLRIDRQLEEALTHGPDPLHLAVVFGLDEKPAIRYASSARQLLETATESHTAG